MRVAKLSPRRERKHSKVAHGRGLGPKQKSCQLRCLFWSFFKRDKHEAIKLSELVHIVSRCKCMNSASQNIWAIIEAFYEKEVTNRNIEYAREFFQLLERRGLDAASLDVANILLTCTDLFRQLDLRESPRLPKPGELLSEKRAQVFAHFVLKVYVERVESKDTIDILDSKKHA